MEHHALYPPVGGQAEQPLGRFGLADSEKVPEAIRKQIQDVYVSLKPEVMAVGMKSGPLGIGTLTIAVSLQVSEAGDLSAGVYDLENGAVLVSWLVDPDGGGLDLSEAPATPTRDNRAAVSVSGSEYYCYRVDGSAYRPDNGPGSEIVLAGLTDGDHSLEVVARAEGAVCPADEAGTVIRWTVDHDYGTELPLEKLVRHESLGEVNGDFNWFDWDGRDDNGAAVPPGRYTVRITVTDGLGRSSSAVTLVDVGDLLADGEVLADAGNAGQDEAHAFGKWAVWQDQRNGDWDIYARDLTVADGEVVPLRVAPLNQERPRTDGRYAVWEERRADGGLDIWARKLGSADDAFAVTDTPAENEKNPVVYWPWVVFQSQPVADPAAPWQVMAYNVIDDRLEAEPPLARLDVR